MIARTMRSTTAWWRSMACCILAALLMTMALVSPALAQSSVRMWWNYFDTDSRHPDHQVLAIAAGHQATLILRDDGRVYSQGANWYEPNLPVTGVCEVPLAPEGLCYRRIATSGGYSLGLLSDGSVATWGVWFTGSGWGFPVVPLLPSGLRYVDVAAGGQHALFLRSDGQLVTSGDNSLGQRNVPSWPAGIVPVQIVAGAFHSAVLLSDGTAVAWGDNSRGQCNLPPGQFLHVSVSTRTTVGVLANGALVACGDNSTGQCNVPSNGIYVLAAAGRYHGVAWRSDGVFEQWGDNSWGQGSGGTPPTVPAGVTCSQLACGDGHTIALMSNGKVLAWGLNRWYESTMPGLPATPAGKAPLNYRDVVADTGVAVALLSDGTIQTWGEPTSAPMPVANEKIVKVGAGYQRIVVLRTDGTLVAWGDNLYGAVTVPPLPSGVVYTDFSTSIGNTAALRSDGQAVQFGDMAAVTMIPPVANGLRYVAVDVEDNQTILMRSDHAVICLGANSNVPPPPQGLQYEQVAASTSFSSGLLSDGSVVHWGLTGGSGWRALPPLPSGVTYVEISGSYDALSARRSDGQVVVCGNDLRRRGRVPPLYPKTSYVQINGMSARVGPTTTYVTFAAGCAGSRPPARLIPMDTPRIGRDLVVNIFDLPMDAAVLAFGMDRTAPVSLAAVGMPGCSSHITVDGVQLIVGQGGMATARIAVPNRLALLGLQFYQQAFVFDPGAGNAAGAVVSNAAAGVIGDP